MVSEDQVFSSRIFVDEMDFFLPDFYFIFQAPPPQAKSSPDKEAKIDLRGSPVDQKPVVPASDVRR